MTDPLISGIAKGSTHYKLVGSYVETPLNWYAGDGPYFAAGVRTSYTDRANLLRAVITGKDAPYKEIQELEGTTIGISRHGSGSEVMAYVMGLQYGWNTNELKFKGAHSYPLEWTI